MSEEKKAVVTLAVIGTFCILLSAVTYRHHDIVMNLIERIVIPLVILIAVLIGLVIVGGIAAAIGVSLWWGLEWCWKKLVRKGGRA